MDTKDYFGVPLAEGDYVVAAWAIAQEPNIAVYEVKGFTMSSVKLLRLGAKKAKPSYRKTNNVMKIDPKMLTFKGLQK